jgi:hypothetical protein
MDEELQVKKCFERVYNTEEGATVFAAIAKKCMENAGSTSNPNEALFCQGKQSIFLYLMKMTLLDPEIYLKTIIAKEFQAWAEVND